MSPPDDWSEILALRARVEVMAARADITACPVDWCDQAGEHWWPHNIDGSRESRMHERETWSYRLNWQAEMSSVRVVMIEDPIFGAAASYVNVHANDGNLETADQVSQLIDGLIEAAEIAFPDEDDMPGNIEVRG